MIANSAHSSIFEAMRTTPPRLSRSALLAAIQTRKVDLGFADSIPAPFAEHAKALGGPAAKADDLGHRLLQRITLGATSGDRAALETLGYSGYLNAQLNYEALDDSLLEQVIRENLPSVSMSPREIIATYFEQQEVPIFELWIATVLRSLYSPRQLFERMVIFWTDHFNVNVFADLANFFKPVEDREVIRRHALGRFPDLLRASAHSPAMLSYLTNDSNHKDHPNENYARELMELHTMGVDAGYTQEDVREVARCFTGWTYWLENVPELGQFRFDPAAHDFGRKVVLGHEIPAGGGVEDGERVLEILAMQPATARFVGRKLLRYFWGYEPPERWVERVANSYLANDGDIRSMLRVILKSSWMESATPKLKRPYHTMISAVRTLEAQGTDIGYLLVSLFNAGQLPFTWEPPNGFPDSAGYWSGFVLPRWNFASTFPFQEASGARLGHLTQLTPAAGATKLTRRIDALLFDSRMPTNQRSQIRRFLQAEPVNVRRVQDALGLALASPAFQEY